MACDGDKSTRQESTTESPGWIFCKNKFIPTNWLWCTMVLMDQTINGHHGEEPKKSISYLQRLDNRTLFLCRNSARSSYSSGSRPPGSYSWILQLMALQIWDSNSYWIKSYALLKIVGLNCQKKPMIGSRIGRNSKKELFCGWEDYSRLTGLDIGWRGALEVWWEWTVPRCKVLWSGLY